MGPEESSEFTVQNKNDNKRHKQSEDRPENQHQRHQRHQWNQQSGDK